MRPVVAGLCASLAAITGCGGPTSLQVTIEAPGLVVASLEATVEIDRARVTRSLGEGGRAPRLPGSLLVLAPDDARRATVILSGRDGASGLLAARGTVDLSPHRQVSLRLFLRTPPDLDGGVDAAPFDRGTEGGADLESLDGTLADAAPGDAATVDGATDLAASDLAAQDLAAPLQDLKLADLAPPVWRAVASGTQAGLRGVWASSASDAYAVGQAGTILHFTPIKGWTAEASGTQSPLNAVWGSGPDDVYAVGDNGTIVRRKGGAWSPLKSGVQNNLRGVWGSAPNDVYLAGNILLHSSGGMAPTWTVQSNANVHELWGGPNGTSVFAVGVGGLILHSNGGGNWPQQASGTVADLHGVWGVPAVDVFVVGDSGVILRAPGGGVWSAQQSGSNAQLQSVWGSAGNDVYAVGAGGTILHGAGGGAWSAQPSGTVSLLYDVFGSGPNDVWIVGAGGTILHHP
ncbi:MAG: hypothetical protein EXR72_02730 [Myxococcales bacterium]|nr:hypothetical protein [Myxococcales bacterium]